MRKEKIKYFNMGVNKENIVLEVVSKKEVLDYEKKYKVKVSRLKEKDYNKFLDYIRSKKDNKSYRYLKFKG